MKKKLEGQIPGQLLQRLIAGILEIASQQRRSFEDENRVLMLCIEHPDAEPREIGEEYSAQYGKYHDGRELIGEGVIRVFRQCRLTNIQERTEMLRESAKQSAQLYRSLTDATAERMKEPIFRHPQYKRLVLLALLQRSEQLQHSNAGKKLVRLNKDFAGECLDWIIEQLQSISAKRIPTNEKEQELERLRISLARTQKLLADLQESFEEQLAESRAEEQEQLISQLNSGQYGHILDQLITAQAGFQKMRRDKIRIPVELRSTQTLVRRLREFVEDCGVSEMINTDEQLTVSVDDIIQYQYEGSPFSNAEKYKTVKVISPGWEIQDRGFILALPRIREIKEEINHDT